MNDLDFVTLIRSAVVFFILSTKVLAFVMLSKARRTSIKSGYIFCTRGISTVLRLDFNIGSRGRLAESLKAVGVSNGASGRSRRESRGDNGRSENSIGILDESQVQIVFGRGAFPIPRAAIFQSISTTPSRLPQQLR
jgi:hypothetical protein